MKKFFVRICGALLLLIALTLYFDSIHSYPWLTSLESLVRSATQGNEKAFALLGFLFVVCLIAWTLVSEVLSDDV